LTHPRCVTTEAVKLHPGRTDEELIMLARAYPPSGGILVTEKIDVLDMVISVLREHEKTMDGLIGKIEGALGEPQTDAFTYIQAISVVESQVYVLKEAWKPEMENILPGLKEAMIRNFVHTLNRRDMVPNDWVEELIQHGTMRLNE